MTNEQERVYISELLEYYKSLLTEKQYYTMHSYYDLDITQSEISEVLETSRQSVKDCIQTCTEKLITFEKNLKVKKLTELLQNREN